MEWPTSRHSPFTDRVKKFPGFDCQIFRPTVSRMLVRIRLQ